MLANFVLFLVFLLSFLLLSGLDSPLQPVCNSCPGYRRHVPKASPYELKELEHAYEPVVVTNYPIYYGCAGSQDQTENVYKCLDKALEFHTDYGKAQSTVWHQHSIPGFQVPGQR